ncbi:short-chain dehydrogenase [Coprinopsis sp. MPI-PUGE-AT-0042]|nr:short-chain dehydrogenase [Coprinopsis sp. MPI-PUGE-AT-0042]
MQLTFWQMLKNQRTAVPPVPVVDLTGKTILVTGANTGIGYETARHFALMKPGKLIIACRSKAKGDEATARLKSATGFSNIYLRLLDLSSFSSTINFADKFEQEEERLDILIANAAISREDYVPTEDGWESGQAASNNLSTLLLNIRLLPLMLKTGRTFSVEPRLVVVGSARHYWSKLDSRIVDSPGPLKAYSSKEYCTPAVMGRRYPETKLLNLFMARSLVKILEETPVVANVACPGYCRSELRREVENSWSRSLMFFITDMLMARTSDEGAPLADNSDGRMRGAYCDSMRVTETSDYSLSEEGLVAEERFWADMIKVLSEVDPKVPVILRDC